jgi:N-acetylmuramoyl-L-alanine amidase
VFDSGREFVRAFGATVRAWARLTFPPRFPNGAILNQGRWLCLLALLLAGCATDQQQKAERVANWEQEDKQTPAPTPVLPAMPVPAPATPTAPPQPPTATATILPTEAWVPLARWCKASGLSAPCPLAATPTPGYALSTTNGVFVLRVGSLLAHWEGLELRLAFAPQIQDGQPYLHALDLKKTIQPVVLGTSMTFLRTNPTIVIDPGHGGMDSGARSVLGYQYEKEFTLDWARRLASLLATNGWRVFLTRTADTDLSLSNRIAFAEAHKAGIFVSLHFNSSAPNDQQVGLETYCLTPAGMPSSVTRGYGDDLGLAFPNNAFDPQNLQLALRVHRSLLQVNGRHDRGVRRARFLGVLRGQHCPAVLVEGGYLSNQQEARRIADPAYRQKLAEAVALALAEKSELAGSVPAAVSQRAEIRAQNSGTLPANLVRP